jgi:hypothetical protein
MKPGTSEVHEFVGHASLGICGATNMIIISDWLETGKSRLIFLILIRRLRRPDLLIDQRFSLMWCCKFPVARGAGLCAEACYRATKTPDNIPYHVFCLNIA